MKPDILRKSKSLNDFLFFFGMILFFTSFFIFFITLKNDCIYLRNEIYHLENIRTDQENKAKVLGGKVNNLSRQDRIEQVAFEKFNMHVPAPESLIVYVGDFR